MKRRFVKRGRSKRMFRRSVGVNNRNRRRPGLRRGGIRL